MVCLGNICRSPIAEGVMQHLASAHNLDWVVDSAGTSSFHSGDAPHRDSIAICKEHGIDIRRQRSRPLREADFDHFDSILVMDDSNYENVLKKSPNPSSKSKVHMLLSFASETDVREVPDPYYVGGFDYVYDLIEKACQGYIASKLS